MFVRMEKIFRHIYPLMPRIAAAMCAVMLAAVSVPAAFLHFAYDGPETLRPGDSFTLDVNVTFSEEFFDEYVGEPAPEIRLNIRVPDAAYLHNVTWATEVSACDWLAWHQSETNAYVLAHAWMHENVWAYTGQYTLATLHCYAQAPSYEPFFFETWYDDFYTEILIDGIDVLGDGDEEGDGIDEFVANVLDIYGYTLRADAPVRVPFHQTPIPVTIYIEHGSDDEDDEDKAQNITPHMYDRVRITLEHDEYDLTNIYRAFLPSFFTNIQAGVYTTNIIVSGQSVAFQVPYVEAECAPTNYVGPLAVFHFLPLNAETDVMCDMEIGVLDFITRVDCHGVIDLLGRAGNEADGMINAEFYIAGVNDLHLRLEPRNQRALVHSNLYMDVVVSYPSPHAILVDEVDLVLALNSAHFYCAGEESFSLATGLTSTTPHVTYHVDPSLSEASPTWPYGVEFTETNAQISLQLYWIESPVHLTNGMRLGTITLTPRRHGESGILLDESGVLRAGVMIDDLTAYAASWPFTCMVYSEEDAAQRVVELMRGDSGPAHVAPGTPIEYVVRTMGEAVTNASYSINWRYSPAHMQPYGDAITGEEILPDGSTAQVVRVTGEFFTAEAGTQELARLQFTAEHPGVAHLTPLHASITADTLCYFIHEGHNILGVPGIEGSGVGNIRTIVRNTYSIHCDVAPRRSMIAGANAPVYFSVRNPESNYFTHAEVRLQLYLDEVTPRAPVWELTPEAAAQAEELYNYIAEIPEENGDVRRVEARLGVRFAAPVATEMTIASLMCAVFDDEPDYMLLPPDDEDGETYGTAVRYNGVKLTDETGLRETVWRVIPNAVRIRVDDGNAPVILGEALPLTFHVDNPYRLPVSRVIISYEFDAGEAEIDTLSVMAGLNTQSADIRVNNSNEGEGYIIADIQLSAPTNATSFAVASCMLRPKMNTTMRLEPADASYWYDDMPEETPAVYDLHGINLLTTYGQMMDDVCPAWTRGVAWRPMPQVSFDDIYLMPGESAELDLLSEGEGLSNGSENKAYRWWAEGNTRVQIAFYDDIKTAYVHTPVGWSGEETFRIYCQEITASGGAVSRVGHATVRVVVEDSIISLPRTRFITATDYTWDNAVFTLNALSTSVYVRAEMARTGTEDWFPVTVRDDARGRKGTDLSFNGRGRVIWHTPSTPGEYKGRLILSHDERGSFTRTFTVKVLYPHVDSDGDRYVIMYNGEPLNIQDQTIRIRNGSHRDVLDIRVFRGPAGDGLVELDSIISDAGFRRIRLSGTLQLLQTDGPIGRLDIEGGRLEKLVVGRGGVGNIRVRNRWCREDGAFVDATEVGIGSMYVTGSVRTVSVKGGVIGGEEQEDGWELVVRRGNLGTVRVSPMSRRVRDFGEFECYIEAGEIWASIDVDGAIGRVIARGGDIGLPFSRDGGDVPQTIRAGQSIQRIRAQATRDTDAMELRGGAIRTSVYAGGDIGTIQSVGSGIYGEEIDIDEAPPAEDLPYGRIDVRARSLRAIISRPRIALFRDGPQIMDWFRVYRGGTLAAYIDVQTGVRRIRAQGGDASLVVYAPQYIHDLRVMRRGYRPFLDDNQRDFFGGLLVSSRICAAEELFRSENYSTYTLRLQSLRVDGLISHSWLGFIAPKIPLPFRYGGLHETEMWYTSDDLPSVIKMPK